MGLSGADLITLAKQHVGNRASSTITRDWYLDNAVQPAYQDLTTLSIPNQMGGHRTIRFEELYDYNDVTIDVSELTTNFQANQSDTWALLALYDLDNSRPVRQVALRTLMRDDPTATGELLRWAPFALAGAPGYLIYKIPSDDLNVREHVYKRAEALADGATEPVIPDEWHEVIHLLAGAKAARLLNLPDLSAALTRDAYNHIQSKRLPREEVQRDSRSIQIGRWSA